MPDEPQPRRRSLGNVFYIGLLSFFGGISQDIFLPILPIYLTGVLGFSKEFVGLSEGLVTASSSLFKVAAGFFTDKLRRRKPIIFLGYLLSFLSRPLLGLVAAGAPVVGLRFLDGVGKGVKDSPKDALIADSTEKGGRGKGFGVARMLDTLGSVAGPLLLFGLLYLLADNPNKYHYILFLSALPLLATLGILIFKVRETMPVQAGELSTEKKEVDLARPLPLKFFLFLGIMLVFALGNSSDAFLILRAQNVGVALLAIPLVYALFNLFYAAAAVPLGSLSDRIGREKVILLGWAAYALAYLGFALAVHSYQIWILFAFYGVYYATTEGVAKALVADLVGREYRGRAYGIYNASLGVMALPASLIAGRLWDRVSPAAPFFFGSVMTGLAAILLLFFLWWHRDRAIQIS